MAANNSLAASGGASQGLCAKFGQLYSIDPAKVATILKNTCFKQPVKRDKNGDVERVEVSDEQLTALMVLAEKYHLNPFIKEIYAFPDKQNGIVPVIGVDGWLRIANENPHYDGMELRYSEEFFEVDPADKEDKGKSCYEWVEAVVYRKDKSHPTVIREYLDECYRKPFVGNGRNGTYTTSGPWQSHPKRMLRHKAMIQGLRVALGFGGIYDEDEAERIASARMVNIYEDMQAPFDVTPGPALPPAPTVDERYATMLTGMGLTENDCAEYLEAWAKHINTDLAGVKMKALSMPQDFLKMFSAWINGKKAKANGNASAQADSQAAEPEEPREAEKPKQARSPKKAQDKIECMKSGKAVMVSPEKCDGCESRKDCPSHPDSGKDESPPAVSEDNTTAPAASSPAAPAAAAQGATNGNGSNKSLPLL